MAVAAVRLHPGGRAGEGPVGPLALGTNAGRLVRDRGIRSEDGKTTARHAAVSRLGIPDPFSVGYVKRSVCAHDSAIRNPQSAIGHVTVEVVAWVTQFVGGDGTRRRIFEEAVTPGATVRSVLVALSDRHATLRDVLWDRAAGDLS